MHEATITLKIPNGCACRECTVIVNRPAHPKGVYSQHSERCALFDKALSGHRRNISGTRDPWSHNEQVWVVEKFNECREKYPDTNLGVVTR